MTRAEIRLFDFITYWGVPAAASVSVLLLVLFSKDKNLRRTAVFSLFCFLLTTYFVLYIKSRYFIEYSFLYRLRSDWLPFRGWNILVYFVFADFIFYFYHRFNHSVPLLWIGHFGHHASDHLHFALSVRENILIHIFVLPFAFLGVPLGLSAEGVLACLRLIILYQGFLHFHVRRDIPLLNYIFITPYFHIIHHSAKFVGAGQNYGGVLSIWDRIFGTHHEGPEFLRAFGIEGLKNPNSLRTLNFDPIADLFRLCWAERSFRPLFFFKHLSYRPRGTSIALYAFAFALFIDLMRRSKLFS